MAGTPPRGGRGRARAWRGGGGALVAPPPPARRPPPAPRRARAAARGGTAGQVCSVGACAATCASPLVACSGACVDTQSDSAHCGGCGTACSGGKACVAGVCGCPTGTTDCGGVCVDTLSSPSNCGACGTVCPAGAPACTSGRCLAACGSGLSACGGACVDPSSANQNCGGCGIGGSGGPLSGARERPR